MALFGNDDNRVREVSKLQNENLKLSNQIAEYEKVFVNFEDMKKVTDRVREENKRLLDKLEESVEVKAKMQKRIDELSLAVNAKREEFKLNINAIESKESDISLNSHVEVTGGIETQKAIHTDTGVVVQGELKGKGQITVGKDNHIYGNVSSEENVTIGNNTTIEHEIISKGTVTVGENCVIRNIISDSNVIIGKSSRIKKIIARGTVKLNDCVKIEEGIEYMDSINMGNDVTITGEIKVREG